MSNDSGVIRFDQSEIQEAAAPQMPADPADSLAASAAKAAAKVAEGAATGSSLRVQVESRIEAAAPKKLALGRGLDVGTANILSAVQDAGGKVTVKRERNAFLEIPSESGNNLELLTKLNVPYVTHRDKFFVLGDVSFQLANMFGREVRRPMQDGFLSPLEQDAIPIMRFLG